MLRTMLGAMLSMALAASARGQTSAGRYPPLTVEGGFDNAQLHATAVQDPTGPRPTVVIGGERKAPNHAVATRHQHKYHHFHLKLNGLAGRTVRFLYGPFPGVNPHVSVLKTPVVYYDPNDPRYELVCDVKARQVFLGQADEGRDKDDNWGVAVEFSHRFRQDTALLCQTFPFGNDEAARLAEQAGRTACGRVVRVGTSPFENLPLLQIIVTDPNVPDGQKRGIWLYAGEDPWEFPGSIACAGAVRWAMSEEPLARRFRQRFVLSAIPLVQPDAVRRGWTNYSLDEAYTRFINFSRTWHEPNIPEHDAVKQALGEWKRAGRPLDYIESMHSSLSWGSFLRRDYGDANLARAYVEGLIQTRYMPWYGYQTAGSQYADIAEKTGFVAFAKTLYPDVVFYASHTEQVLMPTAKLPGFPEPPFPAWGKKDWTEQDSRDMRARALAHQPPDIEAWGVYRMLALMELYGQPVDANELPPQLVCGQVDGYATPAGQARTFTVVYRDLAGRPPKQVALHLPEGPPLAMTRRHGDSPRHAVRFQATVTIQKGKSYEHHFSADNGHSRVRYPPQGDLWGPYAAD